MTALNPTPLVAERFTTTVPTLATIAGDRRAWLAQNPEGKSPVELNHLVPEITAIELDNTLAQARPGNRLTLAAWNLERGRYWREAAHLLRTHPVLQQVDLLCLSEMDHGMVRSHNDHTTRELALALGMNYVYGVEFLQLTLGTPAEQARYDGDNLRGYHGNAILSRFPLQNVRMLRFPGIEKWYDSSEHRLGGRNAILAEIAVGTQTLTLISTHLESGPEATAKRTQEGQMIVQEVAATCGDRPVILCGDLNSPPDAPVIDHLRQVGFQVDDANDLSRSTYQERVDGYIRLGLHHIDYIMARGLTVVRSPIPPAVILGAFPCHPTGKLLSDHAIVVANLEVQSAI